MKTFNNLEPISKDKLSLFEIEDPRESGEYHIYHIYHNKKYIVLGSITNAGFNPSFYFKKDDTFTIDEQLQGIYDIISESLINDEELSGLIEI